jgi:hypothetical protein
MSLFRAPSATSLGRKNVIDRPHDMARSEIRPDHGNRLGRIRCCDICRQSTIQLGEHSSSYMSRPSHLQKPTYRRQLKSGRTPFVI